MTSVTVVSLRSERSEYLEAHNRLRFGSHETLPIIWTDKSAPAIQFKSRELTGRTQILPWWLGGK
jgi:hypothetical protein